MMDKEVLYFACQYLQEAVNDSMTTENDSTVAIFYNKCLKDISTGTGKFVTDKEMLVFACQQLEKMAIETAIQAPDDSMQILNKWKYMEEKLKLTKISAKIPCAVGDTVYLTHGYSEDIWDMEDKGVNCGHLTEIKKGVVSALLTSLKTEEVYAEISIGQDTYITVSARDYFDKYRIHPTAERAEAYVQWLSNGKNAVVYAVNSFVFEYFYEGRKAFNVFQFVDYNEIVGITPSGAKVFFTYSPEREDVTMRIP